MDTQTDETKPDRQPNTGKSGYSYNNKIFVDYQDKTRKQARKFRRSLEGYIYTWLSAHSTYNLRHTTVDKHADDIDEYVIDVTDIGMRMPLGIADILVTKISISKKRYWPSTTALH